MFAQQVDMTAIAMHNDDMAKKQIPSQRTEQAEKARL